jgi:hypothetical protein
MGLFEKNFRKCKKTNGRKQTKIGLLQFLQKNYTIYLD